MLVIAGLGSFPLLKGKNQFAVTADVSPRFSRPRKVSKFFHGRKIVILAWSVINIGTFLCAFEHFGGSILSLWPCELRKTTVVVSLGFLITV